MTMMPPRWRNSNEDVREPVSVGGRVRVARYHTALGSLREALACCEVGEALGYVPALGGETRQRFDHVLGTLVRLAMG